jgi:hypothetical protein
MKFSNQTLPAILRHKRIQPANDCLASHFGNRHNAPGSGNRDHYGLRLDRKCFDQAPEQNPLDLPANFVFRIASFEKRGKRAFSPGK